MLLVWIRQVWAAEVHERTLHEENGRCAGFWNMLTRACTSGQSWTGWVGNGNVGVMLITRGLTIACPKFSEILNFQLATIHDWFYENLKRFYSAEIQRSFPVSIWTVQNIQLKILTLPRGQQILKLQLAHTSGGDELKDVCTIAAVCGKTPSFIFLFLIISGSILLVLIVFRPDLNCND